MDWLKQNWITVVVVAVIAFVIWSAMGRKGKSAGESIQVNMRCPKCKWQGVVSKYAVACRKCGNKDMKPV